MGINPGCFDGTMAQIKGMCPMSVPFSNRWVAKPALAYAAKKAQHLGCCAFAGIPGFLEQGRSGCFKFCLHQQNNDDDDQQGTH